MSFAEFGLNEALMRAIARVGYTQPTPIQSKAIPAVLSGRDLLAAAQTGTGKTAAFTLPILEQLHRSERKPGRKPMVLVLTPTRELAAQVGESVREYGGEMSLRSTIIFGGVSAVPQVKILRQGVDILIATPGRLLDLMQQGHVNLGEIRTLVLDEADRMLDMGFIHDIRRVIKALPAKRQNLLFSATFSHEIRTLAKGLLQDPAEVDVAPRNSTAELIAQKVVFVAKHQKRELLSWMIGFHDWQQVLVFTRTKHGANRLCSQLETDGLTAAALHGNKSQGARTRALAGFKSGSVRVLVATDIAARGLDIDQLPHVINYELPNVPEDYVHRIGRTGRAGVSGEALSLICAEERPLLRDIQKLLGRTIEQAVIEEFHLVEEKAEPAGAGRNASGRPGGQQPARRATGNPKRRRGSAGGAGADKHGNAPRRENGAARKGRNARRNNRAS